MSAPEAPKDSGGEAYRVEACGPAQRAEQAELHSVCFKKPADAAGLAWRYDANPHGTSVSLLTRTAAGQAVSGYACNPRRALAQGVESSLAVIGETGDVMTHPDFRKLGLFSALDEAARARTRELGWPLVFGLPNRRSAHIFLELGWKQVGVVRPWTFLLHGDAGGRLVRRQEGRLAAWLAPLDARRCARSRARLAKGAGAWRLRALERFPAGVEALSRAVEPRFALMVRRDAAYLDWRFLHSPSGLHRAFAIENAAGELGGYVVIQVPRAGETQGYLVDLLAPEEAAAACGIAGALGELERAGASAVRATAVDGSWWRTRLEEAGFLPPKPENHLAVIVWIHEPAHPLAAPALEAARWYLTDGDRDDETMG